MFVWRGYGENVVGMNWEGQQMISRLEALAVGKAYYYARIYSYSRLRKGEPLIAPCSQGGGGVVVGERS